MSSAAVRNLILVLGDQLTPAITSLAAGDPARDLVLMAELADEARSVRHHKKKIAFLFSAMRHFAAELRGLGWRVEYVTLDAAGNRGSFTAQLGEAIACHGPERVIVTEAGEWRVRQMQASWAERFALPVDILPDERFLCPTADFARWAGGRKQLRMEYFYREMRRRTGLLMDGDEPAGGRWNFDAENRKPAKADLFMPRPPVPLNAAEGFIRQIVGWREYVRGIYWLKMPGYERSNFFGHTRRLPDFYWTGETAMACARAAVMQTREHAYAHHIQRLMITGNFALLAGIDPHELHEWYLTVYADAYEWVELPNTVGMSQFADGGLLASKPYAASGAYINRMSDYCGGCRYDVKQRTGAKACPFNALYWDFVSRHRAKIGRNPRMAQMVRTYDKFPADERQRIADSAAAFLASL